MRRNKNGKIDKNKFWIRSSVINFEDDSKKIINKKPNK